MKIPSRQEVLDSVTDTKFKVANWTKHRDHCGKPYPYADAFHDLDGGAFPRSRVFADFADSDQRGVISSIKWGYPRGGRPRGAWQAFSHAFRSSDHADAVRDLKGQVVSATYLIRKLNALTEGREKGLGTATTSKIAYFAQLQSEEGSCLIYDSMVRRALRFSQDRDIREDTHLAPIRDAVVRRTSDLTPREQENTYGIYIAALTASAAARGIDPDQLELALFREGRAVGNRTNAGP